MKNILTLLLFLCLSETKAYTVDDIKKEYATIFTEKVMNYDGKPYTSTMVNKLPDNNFLADFVNNNHLYIDYILSNYSTVDKQKLNSLTADTIELNNYFHNSLRTDSIFNNYFLEATHYYLNSIGKEITDHKLQGKLNLSTDSLITIASRFFYATKIKDNGEVQWHICVGKNGYYYDKKTNMIPLIEAFCFKTIMEDLTSDEFKVVSDFKKNIKQLQSEPTEKKGEDKLNYYRQTMYQMMIKEDKLKQLLLDKYGKKKNMLNFTLTEKEKTSDNIRFMK